VGNRRARPRRLGDGIACATSAGLSGSASSAIWAGSPVGALGRGGYPSRARRSMLSTVIRRAPKIMTESRILALISSAMKVCLTSSICSAVLGETVSRLTSDILVARLRYGLRQTSTKDAHQSMLRAIKNLLPTYSLNYFSNLHQDVRRPRHTEFSAALPPCLSRKTDSPPKCRTAPTPPPTAAASRTDRHAGKPPRPGCRWRALMPSREPRKETLSAQ